MRRTGFVLGGALCLSLTCATLSAAERPPNIVLLLADDLGWTGVGCFGSDLHETPNIDRLAASGMTFTDAYSACTLLALPSLPCRWRCPV